MRFIGKCAFIIVGYCAFLALKCLVFRGWLFGPLVYSPILWLCGVPWWLSIISGLVLGCLPMAMLHILKRHTDRREAECEAAELLADYVQDRDLNDHEFATVGTGCCGNPKLSPFRCPHCGAVMVCCGECDTLYSSLHPPTASTITVADAGGFPCPHCHLQIHPSWDDPAFQVPFSAWLGAGLGNFLIHKSVEDRVAALAKRTRQKSAG